MGHAFCRTAKTHGYNGYFQNGPRSNRGINTGSGGSAVFVRQGIPQRFGARFDLEDSQGVFVWVDGLFVGSVYAPPYEHCSHGATNGLIQAFVEARVLDSTKWLIGGDFNETPNDSQFAELVRSLNASLSTLRPLLGSKVVGKLTGSVPTALNRFPLSLLRIMSLAIIRFCPSKLIPLSIDLRGVLFPKGPTSDAPKMCPSTSGVKD